MAKPWEKYQTQNAPSKPWEKYQQAQPVEEVPQESMIDKAKGYGLKGLSGLGKALDYAGGVTRTSIAAPLMESVSANDVLEALKGNPLMGDEILKRAGLPEGATLSEAVPSMYSPTGEEWLKFKQGGALDPSQRGTAGLALEIASDPLTYASLGTKPLAQAALRSGEKATSLELLKRAAMNPIKLASEAGGEKIYSGAFKNVDKDLLALGKPPVSPILLDQGFVGNVKKARAENLKINKEAGKGISDVMSQAAQKGATVDMLPATKEAYDLVQTLRTSPHADVVKSADKLEELVQGYVMKGKDVPVDQVNKWKSEVNRLAGKRAFDPISASQIPYQDKVERAIGSGLSDATKESVGKASPELLKDLERYNKTYSATGDVAQKAFRREAKKAVTKNPITAVDAMFGGGALAATHDPFITGALLGTKKAVELANSPLGRTYLGQGLYQGGKYIDPVLRRPSVWNDIFNYDKKDEQ